MKTLMLELSRIQHDLKAPKNQFNSFGKYKYRNCEDIFEGLKPLLNGLAVKLTDEIVAVGDRIYVKATAMITDGENAIETTAYAREALTKKGMDDSQITGTASSYARKYALNGLFLIDDTKDADSQDGSQPAAQEQQNFIVDELAKQWIEAIKNKTDKLESIKDPAYRNFIAAEVMK